MLRRAITGAPRARQLLLALGGLCAVCALPACATKKPVLYPNLHLEQVGVERSKQDIAACTQLAKEADLEKSVAAETAVSGAGGAAVGGAAGAVGGAIMGGAARGAGAGAAVGAVVGISRGLFSAREPDPLYKNYVDLCLSERGYQVLGWK